jgi:SNF2 family DNA or RNA helicase
MGLGKTLQVIARLIGEREGDNNVLPTLLVAPTSRGRKLGKRN